MSTIGKVLVFLNLILAAAFLASSIFLLDKQVNYRLRFEDEQRARQSDNDAKQKQIDDGKKEFEGARSEISRRGDEASALKAEKDQLNARLTELATFKDRAAKDIQTIATNLENFRKNNEDLQKSLDDSRKSADAMRDERDAAKKAQDDAENKLAQSEESSKQLDATKNALMEQIKKATDDLARANNGLAVYAEKTGIPIDQVTIAPPLIQGNVIAADMGTKIIQLNVGTDANVKPGYGFSIYRGGDYKGEAIILQDVQAKFSTARIVKWMPNRKIEVGDQATTRLF